MAWRIFLFAILVRGGLWALEAVVGIGDDFHSDSVYYVSAARGLMLSDFQGWEYYALNNEFYVVLLAGLLGFANSVGLLRLANLFLGAFVPVVCFRLVSLAGCSPRIATYMGVFATLLPYQSHLSVHVLKDIAFILVGLLTVLFAFKRRTVPLFVTAILLLSIRTYLGAIIALVAAALRIFGPRSLTLILLAMGASASVFLAEDAALLLLARQEAVFEGRQFFENVNWGRPTRIGALILYGFVSPVRQLFVPSIFQAQGFADLAFGTHVLFYQLLFALTIVAAIRKRDILLRRLHDNPRARAMVLICVAIYAFSVAFIDLVTPALGPLVRYREFSFLVLAIASFVVIEHSRPESRNVQLRDGASAQ